MEGLTPQMPRVSPSIAKGCCIQVICVPLCHLLWDPHRAQELEQLHVETKAADAVDFLQVEGRFL